MKKPVTLVILDGFGYIDDERGNAVKGNCPNIKGYMEKYPNTLINSSGMNVGLPDGQMGNSEVGHTNIGAGRVVYQELTRITKAIKDESFFENPALVKALKNCIEKGTALHIMGLLSDGGVHSHNTHLYALVQMAESYGIAKVFVHCFLDGRDVSPSSGASFIKECEEELKAIGTGKIATVMGRYYAMDRDNRWERVFKAYDALVNGNGEYADNAVSAVESSYKEGVTDEFVIPTVIEKDAAINPEDSVIFYNFRPDRAREITRTLVDPDFNDFERARGFFPLYFICMTQYDATMPNVNIAFSPQSLKNTLGEYISTMGIKQLRIAETEKYAHATFFFNGGVEQVYEGEDRVLIPSPKVATYDLKPEMSAFEVCDAVTERIQKGIYDLIVLNFANCDMVGHTGVFEAASRAVKAVDTCLKRVVDTVLETEGICVITADHGNAEKMLDTGGSPFTAHTTNPVPFIVIGYDCKLQEKGKLADIAPTLLDIMEIQKPLEMDGKSLIKKE